MHNLSILVTDGLLQQTTTPGSTAKNKKQQLQWACDHQHWTIEEHDSKFSLLEWPVQSSDLNPVQHLWDEMEWAVCSMNVLPSNLQQLRDAIAPASMWNVSDNL
jgi:TPP-dependent trihydroxycyclohexane-1,2-dione (THcHDO) dehydratase